MGVRASFSLARFSRTTQPRTGAGLRGQKAYTQAGRNSTASVSSTESPRGLSMRAPSGATGMKRQGRKYRCVSRGQKN